MPNGTQEITFLSWSRERLADLATSTASGRARGEATVTLTGRDAGGASTGSATRQVGFLLAGPADVGGLNPGAVTARYPAPGTIDHESDRCPHAEFGDPSLPWRYTPAGNPGTGAQLHPWLVLVVGAEGDELTVVGDRVTLGLEVQAAHPLGTAGRYPWAHVQIDGSGRRVARVLSGRRLDPGTDYLAALVPAFTATAAAWAGTAPVTLPLYDHWRFRTATPAGSFEDLASRLHPGDADPTTGRAPVAYPRVPVAGDLEVRGALAPLGAADVALSPSVAADLAALRSPATDQAGRPILGLPRYGDAWHTNPDATTWGAALNGDPRHRGAAGIGLELAIRLQEELAAEAAAHAGALAEARQRISDLVTGLAAAGGLWRRRLPADPLRRLWVLGPALPRVVTGDGPVARLATAPDRALPRGVFSSAARRALRFGPARTAALLEGTVDPRDVLAAVNRCPVPPPASVDGVPLGELGMDDFDERRRRAVWRGDIDTQGLSAHAEQVAAHAAGVLGALAATIVDRLVQAGRGGGPAPWPQALALLAAASTQVPSPGPRVDALERAMVGLVERFDQLAVDDQDLVALLEDMEEPEPEEPPCRPVDLGRLAETTTALFDPRGSGGAARTRVLATIAGLDPAQPLAPPEVCVGLDRPVWLDVERTFPEWLLPGVGRLAQDAVIAVETNPVFVDAILAGLNTQLLAELRWRNLPVASGCTPMKVFWGRHDAAGARVDDIRGLHAWPAGSDLGDAQHRPPGAAGRDLVLVIRGELFRRYPATVVYLVSAVHGAAADFTRDPPAGAARVLPSFQGRIGADVTLLGFQGLPATDIARRWVVLEEPPAGFRFANDVVAQTAGLDGASFAKQAFANPVRVLVRGDTLNPGGTP